MGEPKTIDLERSTYIWDGNRWYHAKTFVTPPTVDVLKLNSLLVKAIEEEDLSISDIDVLLDRAREAGEALQYYRVGQIAQQILKLEPSHGPAATMLCSSLRAQNRPAQALKATQPMKDSDYAPLLVSRAAALCDMERWQEALGEITRAQAVGAGKLATQILRRIKTKTRKPNERMLG
ncbi:MAG: hypothetical protein AB9873_20655 [Syntrophobacteraceae bacterium]